MRACVVCASALAGAPGSDLRFLGHALDGAPLDRVLPRAKPLDYGLI
ncbi:MAG TPA: hypothetical protein VJO54_02775 [Burkholderiales bacterium]|nr:hypothetical protein [Burkholderiales bacterium]